MKLSTSPEVPVTHWRQIHYPLANDVAVAAGDTVEVEIALDTRVEKPLSVAWMVQVKRGAKTIFQS